MLTGNQRLLVLAAALRANAANPTGAKFDLATWMIYPQRKGPTIDCGTVVCAVGLACIVPELKAEGLSWSFNYELTRDPAKAAGQPTFEGRIGFPAVINFFELSSMTDAEHLFVDVNYVHDRLPTVGAAAELAVAERIEEFVAARS